MIGFDRYIIITLFCMFHLSGCTTDKNTVGLLLNKDGAFNGFTLFTVHKETYLINNQGKVVNQWSSNYNSGKSVYLLENGNLLRAAEIPNPGNIIMPSIGGRIELFDWNGNLLWTYDYSTVNTVQHHDIFPMPNGNILILAVSVIEEEEARRMGRKLLTPPSKQLFNERIIELKPKNSNDAEIVWEWNIADHLIQEYDSTKENYGNVGKNPQRLDINYLGTSGGGANWIHMNSVQYNVELDQIIMSSKHLNEIYIIDHSTTTIEAASSSGGRYNKGGDFLYRWGNPAVYKKGTEKDQMLFAPHFPHWINNGCPDAGKIIVFNNGTYRKPEFSEVFILSLPEYSSGIYEPTSKGTYGPQQPEYIYRAPVKTDFYSSFKSSAQQLPNGNILICEAEKGHFFEVNSKTEVVWRYINPVGSSGILCQGDDPEDSKNFVFRATKYPPYYKAFLDKNLTSKFNIEDQCIPKAIDND